MIRHDFRRTAVRNMVTGDIPTFGHDGHGPSDLLGVRSMPHREPGGPSGCGSTPLDARGGHNSDPGCEDKAKSLISMEPAIGIEPTTCGLRKRFSPISAFY